MVGPWRRKSACSTLVPAIFVATLFLSPGGSGIFLVATHPLPLLASDSPVVNALPRVSQPFQLPPFKFPGPVQGPLGGHLWLSGEAAQGPNGTVGYIAINAATQQEYLASFDGSVTLFSLSTGAQVASVRIYPNQSVGTFGIPSYDPKTNVLFVPVGHSILTGRVLQPIVLALNGTTLAARGSITSFGVTGFVPWDTAFDPVTDQLIVRNESTPMYVSFFNATSWTYKSNTAVTCTVCSFSPMRDLDSPSVAAPVVILTSFDQSVTFINLYLDVIASGITGPAGFEGGPFGYDAADNTFWIVNESQRTPRHDVELFNGTSGLSAGNYSFSSTVRFEIDGVGADTASNTVILSTATAKGADLLQVAAATKTLTSTVTLSITRYSAIEQIIADPQATGGNRIVVDGVANDSNRVFSVSVFGLTLVSKLPTGPEIQAGAYVDPTTNMYYILDEVPFVLQAYDAGTNLPLWSIPWGFSLSFIGVDSTDGLILMLNFSTGALVLFSATTGSPAGSHPLATPATYAAFLYSQGTDTLWNITFFANGTDAITLESLTGGVPLVENSYYWLAAPSLCSYAIGPVTGELLLTDCAGNVRGFLGNPIRIVNSFTTPTSTNLFPLSNGRALEYMSGSSVVGVVNLSTNASAGSYSTSPVNPGRFFEAPRLHMVFVLNDTTNAVVALSEATGASLGTFALASNALFGVFNPTENQLILPEIVGGRVDVLEQVPFPPAPTGPVLKAGNNTVAVSWGTPPLNSPYPVLNYTLSVSTSTTGPFGLTTGITTTSQNVTGLTDGQKYYFRVTAVSLAGVGSPTAFVSSTPAGVPYPPNGLVAVAQTDSSVGLTWLAPTSSDGSPVTSYAVAWANSPSGPWTVVGSVSSLNDTLSGLRATTTYYFRVSATNSVGTGNPSTTVSVTTPAAPSSGPSSTELYAIVGGVIVVLVALALAALVLRRRRTQGPPAKYVPAPSSTDTSPPAPPPGATGDIPGFPPPPPGGPLD